jgi:serine/threonine protein kinase
MPSTADRIVFVDGNSYWARKVIDGGFGRVHLLEETQPRHSLVYRRFLAAKTFHPRVSRSTIRNELESWLGLNHANILPLNAIGTLDDELAALSPWRRDGTLADIDRYTLTPAALSRIVRDTVAGLVYAWTTKRTLHLDLKPSNIFVGKATGDLEVGDWGIASSASSYRVHAERQSLALEGAGTLPYMSPERLVNPKDLTIQTDMFSLGMLVFELIAGSLPFVSGQPIEMQLVTGSYLQRVAVALNGPWQSWIPFVLRCLHPQRERRPPTYDALWELAPAST